MLKSIKLTCFRQHEDLTLNFTDGLQVIRAPNEGGKSTVFEALAYALYGTRALRDSMDETVTWGKKEKDLRAEVTFELGGVDHTFSRSKSGAEVTLDGKVFVTGQTEVSNYASTILGADVNAATVLMLANQNGLRGTLNQGPKATAQVIEALADLDLFDRLLERATETLPMGSAALVQSRLDGLKGQYGMIEVPEEPDHKAQQKKVEMLQAVIDKNTPLEAEYVALTEKGYKAWKKEADLREAKAELLKNRKSLSDQAFQTSMKLDAEKTNLASAPKDLEGVIEGLEKKVEVQNNVDKIKRSFTKFSEVVVATNSIKGTVDDVEKMRLSVEDELTELQDAARSASTDIKVLESQKIKANECSFCGQDISKFPEAALKNASIEEQIAKLQTKVENLNAAMVPATAKLEEYKGILRAQRKLASSLEGLHEYLTIDKAVTPWGISWSGQMVFDDETDYRAELKAARADLDRVRGISTRLEAFKEVVADLNKRISKINDDIESLNVMDEEQFDQLQAAWEESEQGLNTVRQIIFQTSEDLKAVEDSYRGQMDLWEKARSVAEGLRTQIAQAEGELTVLEFNNALVKKIRSARPIVANKLWSMVLASVSTLFSRLRGEKSVVSKDEDGFKVNGKSVGSLSGSTLDILGLAIRVSLTKTFLPGCSFLVLDEPGAAMDDQRETLMLGFLSSVGFKQVFLVTHSDLSEGVADNLIEL